MRSPVEGGEMASGLELEPNVLFRQASNYTRTVRLGLSKFPNTMSFMTISHLKDVKLRA